MLCLSRRNGERLVLKVPGVAPIVIHFELSRSRSCRVGIDAPGDVIVRRAEVLERELMPPAAPAAAS